MDTNSDVLNTSGSSTESLYDQKSELKGSQDLELCLDFSNDDDEIKEIRQNFTPAPKNSCSLYSSLMSYMSSDEVLQIIVALLIFFTNVFC